MTNQSHIVFRVTNSTGQTAITYGVKQTNMISSIETIGGPVTIAQIEQSCARLAKTRERAEKLMTRIETERQAILSAHAEELKTFARELAEARQLLTEQIDQGRELFKKPKTRKFFGIVVGFEKERDKVELPEEETLIRRIETLLKAKADTLVRNVKSLVVAAFNNLTAAEKQMLGCRIITGADNVVVRAESKSDVEKYFAACVEESSH